MRTKEEGGLSNLAYTGVAVGVFINLVVVVLGFSLAWRVAGLRTTGPQDAAAEAQALFAAANFLLGSALIWATVSYVAINRGMLHEMARQREERAGDQKAQTFLLKSDQARRIGGYIEALNLQASGPDRGVIELHVLNASELPVRDVRGFAYNPADGTVAGEFGAISLVLPGKEERSRVEVRRAALYRLELEYDDDAGVRWRKYGSDEPLQQISL